ncbi:unnamed protein product, partial [Bubo scandiacus]
SGDCPQLLPGHEGSPPRHLGWPQRPRTPPPTPPHPTPRSCKMHLPLYRPAPEALTLQTATPAGQKAAAP